LAFSSALPYTKGMRLRDLVLLLPVFLVMVACQEPKAHWMIGTWMVDVDQTKEAFPLDNQLEDLLVEAQTGNIERIEISNEAITTVRIEGESLVQAYDMPDAFTEEELTVQLDNGQSRTYYQRDGKIWYVTPGDLPMQIFLVQE